jgi:hypothetical protein
MQRDFHAFPRRMGKLKPDAVHLILKDIPRECVDALGEQEPSLRPAIRELIDADERWTAANEARWALEAEDFWEGVAECMRRMFAEERIEFRSELSLTRTRLELRMLSQTGRAVEIGSMITSLVDGLRPRLLIKFNLSLLDDVVTIWRTGATVGLDKRNVNIMPATTPQRPYSARACTELVWDGATQSVTWGGRSERTRIHENPLDRRNEFIRFMFQGCDPGRMRWIDEAPPGYQETMDWRRHGEGGVFRVLAVDAR